MDYNQKYDEWMAQLDLAPDIRNELLSIANNDMEKKERFFNDLEFGTGGLRGILGAGTGRMNIYTVRKATQGLAEYIVDAKQSARGVAIAFDSRNNSDVFAAEAARVFAGNGITAYLFDELRPTPELSFAIRHLDCAAGIVVTASHNPAKYNGYKVYGEDGGQVANDTADYVLNKMNNVDIFKDVKLVDLEDGIKQGLIKMIGKEVDDAYLDEVYKCAINPSCVPSVADKLKIVYTPFYGAGNKPVRRIFERLGVKNLFVVEEQAQPDGDFPTVKSPNPEDKEGFGLAIELANAKNADLIIGTDPDSDRVGVLVRSTSGEFIALSGNQTGVLLVDYVLSQLTEQAKMPENPFVVKTIVTSELTRAICKHYDVELLDVLTGFKFIGEKIKEFHETGLKNFVFGFEESYGYLNGTYCRDKDAVAASMLIAEMAAFYALRGMTLYDALNELFTKYGVYTEGVKNIYREGLEGANEIKGMMAKLRDSAPKEIAREKVVSYTDYAEGATYNMLTGEKCTIDLPKSNVLRFELEDKTWVAFRPSGTEPKFKVYFGVLTHSPESALKRIDALSRDVDYILGI